MTTLERATWERGALFFEAACRSVTHSAESLCMCRRADLEAALVYAGSQVWLGKRGTTIKRYIERALKCGYYDHTTP